MFPPRHPFHEQWNNSPPSYLLHFLWKGEFRTYSCHPIAKRIGPVKVCSPLSLWYICPLAVAHTTVDRNSHIKFYMLYRYYNSVLPITTIWALSESFRMFLGIFSEISSTLESSRTRRDIYEFTEPDSFIGERR